MITEYTGDIFAADVEALVNPVNTVGVAGAGLAKEFGKRFPQCHKQYIDACLARSLVPGKVLLTETAKEGGTKYVVHFPTKRHWRSRSQMVWIQDGLFDLRLVIVNFGIRSIAIPALGCGLGGLKWSSVRRLVHDTLGYLNADIRLYGPA